MSLGTSALLAAQDEREAFIRKTNDIALRWHDWSMANGYGLTFSTFVNQFGYDELDAKLIYEAVVRIIQAAKQER